eukprot:5005284-Alexandrium_andersonii.AAC.1
MEQGDRPRESRLSLWPRKQDNQVSSECYRQWQVQCTPPHPSPPISAPISQAPPASAKAAAGCPCLGRPAVSSQRSEPREGQRAG